MAQRQISHLSCMRSKFISSLAQEPFQPPSCQRRVIGLVQEQRWLTHDVSVSLQPWASLARLQHHSPTIVLIWIPRGRDSLSVAVSSWCLPQRLQWPPASVATSDASHLANKSIMRKATASDLPKSPVIPDIEMRGQRRVTACWVMEIRSNWSSESYLGLAFCSNDCRCWNCLFWQKIRGPWCRPESTYFSLS